MRVKGVSVLSWSWLYGSLIYNYQCNQCLPPLKLSVRIPLLRGVLDTTLCDKICQSLEAGRWITWLLWCPPRIKLTATIYLVTEILLKYCSKYKYNLLLWTRCNSLLSTHYNLLLWIYHTYSSWQYKMNSCEFESHSWGCVLVYGVRWLVVFTGYSCYLHE
jgi:hypothetical protein